VLRTQAEIARAIAAYPRVTKAVVGIGAWAPGLSTVADAVDESDRRMLQELGVCGELSGVQFAADGRAVITPLTERLIGIDAPTLHAVPEVVAIAYDAAKAGAVAAAIRGGFVTSLITHRALALELLP
jgi:DNA-binding transcriptional regulator LsrR (DeoR family)